MSQDLAANCSLVFTNANPILDYARPTLHKVVDIGGIHTMKPPQNLSQVQSPLSS